MLLRRSADQRATEGVSTATLELQAAEVEDIERYLDVSRGEILFAKGVVLVEGEAEEYMIPVLAELIGVKLDETGITVCSVAGTHFLPYLKLLGPRGLDITHAVITDSDPTLRTTGLARIRRLLEFLAPEELVGAGSDAEVVLLGKKHGLFLTEHTFEVALFRAGRQCELCENDGRAFGKEDSETSGSELERQSLVYGRGQVASGYRCHRQRPFLPEMGSAYRPIQEPEMSTIRVGGTRPCGQEHQWPCHTKWERKSFARTPSNGRRMSRSTIASSWLVLGVARLKSLLSNSLD